MSTTRKHTISLADLSGLPGLRRKATQAILERQPRTVVEAITIPDVGRKTARALLEADLISDPEDAMHRTIHDISTASDAAARRQARDDGHSS